MKVETLDKQGLQAAARSLEAKASAFAPDLVLGIATGGEVVAGMMFDTVPHVSVKSSRRTTAAKQRLGFVWSIVRCLPLFVRDALRVAEYRWLKRVKREEPEALILDDDTTSAISKSKRVLIVDDAIDSGMTMKRVVEAVRGVPGVREIAIASITETMQDALVVADYKLYGGVLVRFPWSKDYRDE